MSLCNNQVSETTLAGWGLISSSLLLIGTTAALLDAFGNFLIEREGLVSQTIQPPAQPMACPNRKQKVRQSSR